jgi:hypothetical protein
MVHDKKPPYVIPTRLGTTALAILVVVNGLAFQRLLVKHTSASTDGPRYLSVASDLAFTGHYTDGFGDPDRTKRPSGMHVAPLYPALIAAVIPFSPSLAATSSCYAQGHRYCPENLGALVPLQFCLVAVDLLLLWRFAAIATASESIGWIALALAAVGSYEFAVAAVQPMTEALSLALFTGFQLALVAAARRRAPGSAFVAGICLGLTALTRPAFLYIGSGVVVLGMVTMTVRTLRGQHWLAVTYSAAVVGGVLLVVLPWAIRNAVEVGSFDLTRGYGGYNLSLRVAYDSVTWREYVAGWVFYLPDFGRSLAKAVFPPDWFSRLGWNPGSFYDYGNQRVFPDAMAAAGRPERL